MAQSSNHVYLIAMFSDTGGEMKGEICITAILAIVLICGIPTIMGIHKHIYPTCNSIINKHRHLSI